MGLDPESKAIPVFAVSLAKFAVSFLPEKGDFVGRKALEEQFAAYQRIVAKDFCDIAVLPKRIVPRRPAQYKWRQAAYLPKPNGAAAG